MADWNRFSKNFFLENLYKGQNLKVRKFQIHRTLESKVIKRKPTGGAHCAPPPVLIGLRHRSREQRAPSSSPAWTSVLR